MIDEIQYGEPEYVFDLSSIGLTGELVISSSDGCYITTDTDFFPVNRDLSNFTTKDNFFQLKYSEEEDNVTEEGESILNLTKDQFEAIKIAISSLEKK